MGGGDGQHNIRRAEQNKQALLDEWTVEMSQ